MTIGEHEGHPCGHPATVPGCGGCDPGAVEYVRDDGDKVWRKVAPTREALLAAAVEAACVVAWNAMYAPLPWPDACPFPDMFRREERDALLPALAVLEQAGALTWPTT